jgi:hypothetical protein
MKLNVKIIILCMMLTIIAGTIGYSAGLRTYYSSELSQHMVDIYGYQEIAGTDGRPADNRMILIKGVDAQNGNIVYILRDGEGLSISVVKP